MFARRRTAYHLEVTWVGEQSGAGVCLVVRLSISCCLSQAAWTQLNWLTRWPVFPFSPFYNISLFLPPFHFSRGTLQIWNIPAWSSKKVEDSNPRGTCVTYHNPYITIPAHLLAPHTVIPYRGTCVCTYESACLWACVQFSPSFSLPLSLFSRWDIPQSCLYCASAD